MTNSSIETQIANAIAQIKTNAAANAKVASTKADTGFKVVASQHIRRETYETEGRKMLDAMLAKGYTVAGFTKPTMTKAGMKFGIQLAEPQEDLAPKMQRVANARERRAAKRKAERDAKAAAKAAKLAATPKKTVEAAPPTASQIELMMADILTAAAAQGAVIA